MQRKRKSKTDIYFCMRPILFFLFFLSTGMCIFSCANIIAPTGGPDDKTPPRIDSAKTSPNFQTNFEKRPIILTFQEWIKLVDVNQQVIISPPLEHKPAIDLKGKSVILNFDEKEILRENATYTINFGNAIQDLTAGNKASELRFIFSTGPVIDSLIVRGSVKDAQTLQPVEGAVFMLYENLADSVVRTQKPFYFARTDAGGRFTIENVRADTFKVFALVDANVNYLFDQPTEKIGFREEPLIVSDSIAANIDLSIFQEEGPLRVASVEGKNYGNLTVVLNKSPDSLNWKVATFIEDEFARLYGDSLVLWYNMDTVKQWNLYLSQDTVFYDTLKIKPDGKKEFLENRPMMPLRATSRRGKQSKAITDEEALPQKQTMNTQGHNPTQAFRLGFPFPIRSLDTTQILLTRDTLEDFLPFEAGYDSISRQFLEVKHQWEEGTPYKLVLLPGAVTSWLGHQNDSLEVPIQVKPFKDFGNLVLTVEGLDSTFQYMIELIDKSNKVYRSYVVSGKSSFKDKLNTIDVGTYTVRIIRDDNRNGRWDPGNYDKKLQAEPIQIQQIEQLRANWDLEAKVSAGGFDQQAPPKGSESDIKE